MHCGYTALKEECHSKWSMVGRGLILLLQMADTLKLIVNIWNFLFKYFQTEVEQSNAKLWKIWKVKLQKKEVLRFGLQSLPKGVLKACSPSLWHHWKVADFKRWGLHWETFQVLGGCFEEGFGAQDCLFFLVSLGQQDQLLYHLLPPWWEHHSLKDRVKWPWSKTSENVSPKKPSHPLS